MEIYLIRHTTVVVDRNTCYGQTDLDVADSFSREAALVREKIPDIKETAACFSSPLKRCRLLAGELEFNSPVYDERIMEMHFGSWEMQEWKDISGTDLVAWIRDFVDTPAPEGEAYRDLVNRSISFWNDLISGSHDTACVITHSGVVHALVSHVLDIPLEKSFSFFIDYGGVSKINLTKRGPVVEYLNR